MLISSDEFLKGSGNDHTVRQLFDSLCERARLSAECEELLIDQEEIGPFVRLVSAPACFHQSRRRSREVNVFMKEQPDKSRPYLY